MSLPQNLQIDPVTITRSDHRQACQAAFSGFGLQQHRRAAPEEAAVETAR
ncbi:MAG TPA: hypothetical protein VMB34_18415 [Acetobacteraceae bacterium]|nr:hypothetical protein [Acetobacteraceae bacterium]